MRRLIVVGVIAALPLSVLGSVALAGSASATALTPVTCKKLSGSASGSTGTISKCNVTSATGGSGTFPLAALESGSGSITWNVKGSSTAVENVTEGASTGGTCPTEDGSPIGASGTVKKSKGAAKKAIPAGWTFSANVCLNPLTEDFSEAKGSPVTIAPASSGD